MNIRFYIQCIVCLLTIKFASAEVVDVKHIYYDIISKLKFTYKLKNFIND